MSARTAAVVAGVSVAVVIAACSDDVASVASTPPSATAPASGRGPGSPGPMFDGGPPDGVGGGGGGYSGGPPGAAGTAGQAGASGGAGSSDAGVDASSPSDASVPVSTICGDGIRDAVLEECDDGNADESDACLASCRVADVLLGKLSSAGAPLAAGRRLGASQHAAAVGGSAIARAYVDVVTSALSVSFAGERGETGQTWPSLSDPKHDIPDADPAIAALPSGKFAVVWTDVQGDGDELGVAVRLVHPTAGPWTAVTHANTTTAFSQFGPDVVWTGQEIIVAWSDDANASAASDIRFRRFDAELKPLGPEETLSADAASEADVTLCAFGAGFAAAFRSTQDGDETVVVKAGATLWTLGPHIGGPAGDRPALVALDATTLAVAYSVTTEDGETGVRFARLSTAKPGVAEPKVLTVTGEAQPLAARTAHPALARVGARSFLTWTSQMGGVRDLWLGELGDAGLLGVELALPREIVHGVGDQSRSVIAPSALGPEGAIAALWQDDGQAFGPGQAKHEVVFELIPVPVIRFSTISFDGGGGT